MPIMKVVYTTFFSPRPTFPHEEFSNLVARSRSYAKLNRRGCDWRINGTKRPYTPLGKMLSAHAKTAACMPSYYIRMWDDAAAGTSNLAIAALAAPFGETPLIWGMCRLQGVSQFHLPSVKRPEKVQGAIKISSETDSSLC